jgi:hypothetical protein
LLVDSEPSKKPIKFADDYYNDLANNLDNIKRFGLICGDISRLPTDTQIKLLRRFGKTEREIEALLKQQEETRIYRALIRADKNLDEDEKREKIEERVIKLRDKFFWISFKRYFKKMFFDQTFKTRKKAYDNQENSEVFIGNSVFEHRQATQKFEDYVKNQTRYTEEVLKRQTLLSAEGEPLCTLYDLYLKKIDNEKNELINKADGIQKLVKQNNYYSVLVTVTLPSGFHSRTQKFGKIFFNDKFEGVTISKGIETLQKIFSNPNKTASKKKWTVFGLRALQPHHDNSAHMHIYLSGTEEHVKKMCELLEKETRKTFGKKFNEEHSFDVKVEDLKKGQLKNYLLTYLLGNEKTKKGDASKYAKIKEWSQNLNVRRFAWFGLDGVTTTRLAKNEYIKKFKNGTLTQRDKEFFDFFEEEKGKLRFNYQKYIVETGGVGYDRKDKALLKIEKIVEEKTGKYGNNYTLVKGLSFFKNNEQHSMIFEKVYIIVKFYYDPRFDEEESTKEETITTQNNEVAKVSYSFPSRCSDCSENKNFYTEKEDIFDEIEPKNQKIPPEAETETEFWGSTPSVFTSFATT